MVDARLPDGSRVHLITEPSALLGTTITIRKFPEKRLDINDLISFGSLSADFGRVLKSLRAVAFERPGVRRYGFR